MVDYSKWKNIVLSDDEEDQKTPTLMVSKPIAADELKKQRLELDQQMHENRMRLSKIYETIAANKAKGDEGQSIAGAILDHDLMKLELVARELRSKDQKLRELEQRTAVIATPISRLGLEVNILHQNPMDGLTNAERGQRLHQFVAANETLCKEFGMLKRYNDSMLFLQRHPFMVCEDTLSYLVLWSISLQMEQLYDLVELVMHQCICLQYILELSRQLSVTPISCVELFFKKIQRALPDYQEQFRKEMETFKKHIIESAELNLAKIQTQTEALKQKARLGPGGLDPYEVFESLPESIKYCFEKQDAVLLERTVMEMELDKAILHMKRCIDAGIWVPGSFEAAALQCFGANKTEI